MTEVNMAAFIEAKSDQLNADDLLDSPRTIVVTGVSANPDSAEQPVSISYEGDNRKPFKPCKTMRRLIVAVWGADAKNYVGRAMTLYRDADVQFGGMQVGGIRISHMSHIDTPQIVPLMVTRGRKKPFKVEPLKAAPRTDDAKAAADKIAATIARAPDAAMLAQYLTGANVKARIEAWRTERPDLAALIDAARDAKLASLGGDDDDPFGLEEGGATEGEAEEAPPSDDWLAKIDGCKTLAALGAVEAEWFAVRDSHAAPERIDAAFDTMREALKRRVAA